MPYSPPATSPTFFPSKSPMTFGSLRDLDEISNDFILNTIDNTAKERDIALQKVKDILSTSPQLSTSPKYKSSPELYSRRLLPSLKVELPLKLSQEFPIVLRKKSGEILKSSLKKSKSEPPTPSVALPKYVHFGADLEHIKLFKEAQRPQAISAEASDDDDTDDNSNDFDDFLFDDDNDVVEESELVIALPNRPIMTTMHSSKPVFVESIFLSEDKKMLQGRIMVQNISFQKSVHVRYTFDFWSTISEVSATYASEGNKTNFDTFMFSIDLIDNSRNQIDGKTMYFAVHYNVNNNDYWDNNNGSNYHVNFKKVILQSGSNKNYYAISQSDPSSIYSILRPMNESFRHSPQTPNLRKKISGRYDIGVSLSAAQNAPRSLHYTDTFQTPYYENFNTYFQSNYVDGMPGTLDFPRQVSNQ